MECARARLKVCPRVCPDGPRGRFQVTRGFMTLTALNCMEYTILETVTSSASEVRRGVARTRSRKQQAVPVSFAVHKLLSTRACGQGRERSRAGVRHALGRARVYPLP
eukprot:scaffold51459_cov62-Phaeocystis_antarctica.AAC.2